jgi:hypothetical protein
MATTEDFLYVSPGTAVVLIGLPMDVEDAMEAANGTKSIAVILAPDGRRSLLASRVASYEGIQTSFPVVPCYHNSYRIACSSFSNVQDSTRNDRGRTTRIWTRLVVCWNPSKKSMAMV